MSEADATAVAAYRALETAIMAVQPDRVGLIQAFTKADALAQAARRSAGLPRLDYLKAVAS